MSSPKKIGRWNRFEIAFAKENLPQKSLFQTPERSTEDKTRNLRKIVKEILEEKIDVESATLEEESPLESAASRQGRFPASKTPSLWEEARRRKQEAAKKRDKRR